MNDAKGISSEAITILRKFITTTHNKDCLFTSINQFGFLSACGYNPSMCVGGFIPVRKMHAWIELNNKLYFDDFEEIKHFYPLIQFTYVQNMIKTTETISGRSWVIVYYSSPHRLATISSTQLVSLAKLIIYEDQEAISKLDFLPLDFVCVVNEKKRSNASYNNRPFQ